MVISAKEALRSIESAITGVRREEDRLTEMLRTAVDDAARLRKEQADAYRSLARIRLESMTAEQTAGRLDAAERRAMEALDRHNARVAEAAIAVEEAKRALAAAEAERDAASASALAADEAVDALIDETHAGIDGNADWKTQSDVLATAEATAAAAAEKASLAEADRDEKGQPYEADPLFIYLWRNGFGTSAYRAGRIVRYFDGRVAALIGFREARSNYHMLNEIPLRLREHADRLREAAGEERAKLEAIERATLVAAGIEPLEAAANRADEELENAENKVEDLRQDLASASESHAALSDDRRDADLQAALDVLGEEIGRSDLSELYRQALQTPTPRDEQIVAALREIEVKVERREAEAEEVRRTAVDLARKRTELEQSRDNFRQSGFDDPRGQFANGDIIGAAIEGVIRGALSSGALNKTLRDGFSRRMPRAGGSFGGGLRTRRSWSGSRSGGFSTGGRSGGGGFRTGGGF